MKIIFSGLESSGKSLRLAMMAERLVNRNSHWFDRTGIKRSIVSNLPFSEPFRLWADKVNVPIKYWKHLHELVHFDNCDVICDEVGNYFDSRMWQDLSLDVRVWLSQGAKAGIEFYGSAQDFAQVDKAFRRLTNGLLEITKFIGSPRPAATRPPVKHIWGICVMRELDPRAYSEDKKKFASALALPKFFLIQRKYCEIFDTNMKLARGTHPPLRHEQVYCEHCVEMGGDGRCTFHKIVHV